MTVTMRLGLAPKPSAIETGPLGPSLMGDCAEIGLADELGVFRQQPALVARNWRAPRGAARRQFALPGDQVHAPVRDVDPHPIAIAYESERAADGSLW